MENMIRDDLFECASVSTVFTVLLCFFVFCFLIVIINLFILYIYDGFEMKTVLSIIVLKCQVISVFHEVSFMHLLLCPK